MVFRSIAELEFNEFQTWIDLLSPGRREDKDVESKGRQQQVIGWPTGFGEVIFYQEIV